MDKLQPLGKSLMVSAGNERGQDRRMPSMVSIGNPPKSDPRFSATRILHMHACAYVHTSMHTYNLRISPQTLITKAPNQ